MPLYFPFILYLLAFGCNLAIRRNKKKPFLNKAQYNFLNITTMLLFLFGAIFCIIMLIDRNS